MIRIGESKSATWVFIQPVNLLFMTWPLSFSYFFHYVKVLFYNLVLSLCLFSFYYSTFISIHRQSATIEHAPA